MTDRTSMTTKEEQIILNALGDREMTGAEIMAVTGWSSGEIYPRLISMENRGIISSRWMNGPYPRRRVYRKVTTPHD